MWLVLFTSLALHSAPAVQEPEEDPWSELAATFDYAVELWVEQAYRTLADFPAADFWVEFEELADTGDGRAVVWMLQNLEAAGLEPDDRADELKKLFLLVQAAGRATWVADAIPGLVKHRAALEQEHLTRHLESLESDAQPESVRVAAMVGRAQILADADRAAADELGLRAALLRIDRRELGAGETIPADELDELAASTVDELQRAQSSWWFELHGKTEDDVYFATAVTPPDPEATFRPMIEALAEMGSSKAWVWMLTNTWTADEDERARLGEYLDSLAQGGANEVALKRLRWRVESLVRMLGADFVEPRVRMLIEAAEGDQRAGFLVGLGTALCENADEDPEQRERGLAMLTEVMQRWPDTEEAKRAAGPLFRHTNLVVGKVVPDFETQDVDGTAFKLSDYRGKVTVIDFWGFW